jgi:gluconokinase
VRFAYLAGDYDTIAGRLAERRHKYMPATLLSSQFATLEVPADALVIDIRASVDEQVAAIRAALAV